MCVVIALTAVVGSFAISMNTEIRLARNSDYDDKMEWMGRSGIEEARCLLANKSPEQKSIDALNQYWAHGSNIGSNDLSMLIPLDNEPMGEGTRTLVIEDMERKWCINNVAGAFGPPQRDIMQRALQVVGVTDTGLAATIEDSIIDWVRPNSGTQSFSGANGDYYMHLETPYYCKSGQIDDLSELLLVKGVTPDIYWGSNSTNHPVSAYQQHGGGAFGQPSVGHMAGFGGNKDQPEYPYGLVQLFSPLGGKLNINTASALTLQMIPGMDESTAARIIQQRAGPDGVDGTDYDVPFMNIGEIQGGLPGGGPPPGNAGMPGGGMPPGNAGMPGGGMPPGNVGVPGGPAAGLAAQGMAAYIDVRSYVFKVRVDTEINGYKRSYYGIVSRQGSNAQKLNCVKFYWE